MVQVQVHAHNLDYVKLWSAYLIRLNHAVASLWLRTTYQRFIWIRVIPSQSSTTFLVPLGIKAVTSIKRLGPRVVLGHPQHRTFRANGGLQEPLSESRTVINGE